MPETLVKSLLNLKTTQEFTIYIEDVIESRSYPIWCPDAPLVLQTWAEKILQDGNVLCGNCLAKLIHHYVGFIGSYDATSLVSVFLQLNNLVDLTSKWKTNDLTLYISFWELVIDLHSKLLSLNPACFDDHFLEVCTTFLVTSVDPSVTLFLRQIRLKAFNSSLENAAYDLKKSLLLSNLNCIENLLQSLDNVGDYDIQTSLVEAVFRLTSTSERNRRISDWFPKIQLVTQHLFARIEDFDPDCRKFLNAYNKELGDKQMVFSFPCSIAKIGNFILKKPNSPTYEELWIDINQGSSTISLLFDRSEDWAVHPSSRQWETIIVYNHEVQCVNLCETDSHSCLVVSLGRDPVEFFASPPSQEIACLLEREFVIQFKYYVPDLQRICQLLYGEKLKVTKSEDNAKKSENKERKSFAKTSVSNTFIEERKNSLFNFNSNIENTQVDKRRSESLASVSGSINSQKNGHKSLPSVTSDFVTANTFLHESEEEPEITIRGDSKQLSPAFNKKTNNVKENFQKSFVTPISTRSLFNENISSENTDLFPSTPPKSSSTIDYIPDAGRRKSKLKKMVESDEQDTERTERKTVKKRVEEIICTPDISDSLVVQVGTEGYVEGEYIPTVVYRTPENQEVNVDSDEDIIPSSLTVDGSSSSILILSDKRISKLYADKTSDSDKQDETNSPKKSESTKPGEKLACKEIAKESLEVVGGLSGKFKVDVSVMEINLPSDISVQPCVEDLKSNSISSQRLDQTKFDDLEKRIADMDFINPYVKFDEPYSVPEIEISSLNTVLGIDEKGDFTNNKICDEFKGLQNDEMTLLNSKECEPKSLTTIKQLNSEITDGDFTEGGYAVDKLYKDLLNKDLHEELGSASNWELTTKKSNKKHYNLDIVCENSSTITEPEQVYSKQADSPVKVNEHKDLEKEINVEDSADFKLIYDIDNMRIMKLSSADDKHSNMDYVDNVREIKNDFADDYLTSTPLQAKSGFIIDQTKTHLTKNFVPDGAHELNTRKTFSDPRNKGMDDNINKIRNLNELSLSSIQWDENDSIGSENYKNFNIADQETKNQKMLTPKKLTDKNPSVNNVAAHGTKNSEITPSSSPKSSNKSNDASLRILADYPVNKTNLKTPLRPIENLHNSSKSKTNKKKSSQNKELPDHFYTGFTPSYSDPKEKSKGKSKRKLFSAQESSILEDSPPLNVDGLDIEVLFKSFDEKDRVKKHASNNADKNKTKNTSNLFERELSKEKYKLMGMKRKTNYLEKDQEEPVTKSHKSVFSDFGSSDSSEMSDWFTKKKRKSKVKPVTKTYAVRNKKRSYVQSFSYDDSSPNSEKKLKKGTRNGKYDIVCDSNSDSDGLNIFGNSKQIKSRSSRKVQRPQNTTYKSSPPRKFFTRSVAKRIMESKLESNNRKENSKEKSVKYNELEIKKTSSRRIHSKNNNNNKSFGDNILQNVSSPEVLRDTSLTQATSFEDIGLFETLDLKNKPKVKNKENRSLNSFNSGSINKDSKVCEEAHSEYISVSSPKIEKMKEALCDILPLTSVKTRERKLNLSGPPEPPNNTPNDNCKSYPIIIMETQDDDTRSSLDSAPHQPAKTRFSYANLSGNTSYVNSKRNDDVEHFSYHPYENPSPEFNEGINRPNFESDVSNPVESTDLQPVLGNDIGGNDMIPSRPNSDFSSSDDEIFSHLPQLHTKINRKNIESIPSSSALQIINSNTKGAQNSTDNITPWNIESLSPIVPPSLEYHQTCPTQESEGRLPSAFRDSSSTGTQTSQEDFRIVSGIMEISMNKSKTHSQPNIEDPEAQRSNLIDIISSVGKYISNSLTPKASWSKTSLKTPQKQVPRILFGASHNSSVNRNQETTTKEEKSKLSPRGSKKRQERSELSTKGSTKGEEISETPTDGDLFCRVPLSTMKLIVKEADALGVQHLEISRRLFVLTDVLNSVMNTEQPSQESDSQQ